MTADEDRLRFIVPQVIPTRELHLIYGPISDDVTSLAILLLNEWSQGAETFNRSSNPVPFCYVTLERTAASLLPGLRALDIDPRQFPHLSILKIDDDLHQFRTVMSVARNRVPNLRLLVIDGILRLCRGRINEYKDVSNFLTGIVSMCAAEDLTVIICTTSTKAKGDAGYASARDRVHGSLAWTNIPSTKILIEPVSTKPTDPNRNVILMPLMGKAEEFPYTRVEHALAVRIMADLNVKLDAWLKELPKDKVFTTSEVIEAADQLGISQSTAERWIRGQLELGTIERCTIRGSFRRTPDDGVQ